MFSFVLCTESYGEQWILHRTVFNDVPLSENFQDANRIAASLWSLLNVDGAPLHEAFIPGLIRTIQKHFLIKHRTKMAFNTIGDLDGLKKVIARNGTARATTVARSHEWLETNGYCMDHIYVNRSTIYQAGNGAFTRRNLNAGSVIHTSPLIAGHRTLMEMSYNGHLPPAINSKQLLLNYHFGHPDSSILFLPISHLIAINHDGTAPNARVEFSTRERKSRYLLHRPLEDIYSEKYSAMVIDVVALRDIAQDEEIMIDYGPSWQRAWEDHIQNWTSPCTGMTAQSSSSWFGKSGGGGGGTGLSNCVNSSYQVVHEMNQDIHNPKYHKWSNVHMTECTANITVPWENGKFVYLVPRIPASLKLDPTVQIEFMGMTFHDERFDYSRQHEVCEIITSHRQKDTVDVLYFYLPEHVPEKYEHPKLPDARVVVKFDGLDAKVDVKHRHKPLTWDWHDPQAFRHEIHIPDASFPELWKDRLSR
jgi:hypothetical protein